MAGGSLGTEGWGLGLWGLGLGTGGWWLRGKGLAGWWLEVGLAGDSDW